MKVSKVLWIVIMLLLLIGLAYVASIDWNAPDRHLNSHVGYPFQ